MNILFVSKDSSSAALAQKFQADGHSVRFYVEDRFHDHSHHGILEKAEDWRACLDWVSRDGLIIFDSIGHGRIQDELREQGYSVFGGNEKSDILELDRPYCQEVFARAGIPFLPSWSFSSMDRALRFVAENKGPWVVKQNGHADKIFNYVGEMEDGQDVASVLRSYCAYEKTECQTIDIQKKVTGIEIGVARYFNGHKWVGPIEFNVEHKALFPCDLGPKTYEMGTLMWMDRNENNRLFQSTLAKLEPYLREIDFRGDVDINCIIDGQKIHPLEITSRLGWPATHLHYEFYGPDLAKFFKAVADGQDYEPEVNPGYGVVVLMAMPPFPYQSVEKKYSARGHRIFFKDAVDVEHFRHIHMEEISLDSSGAYVVSGDTGFILHVSSLGESVTQARENAESIMKKIVIPKSFYRNDIGLSFERSSKEILETNGWL